MKFMKLGSRPDTFCTMDAVRSVSSEVTSDLIVQVKGIRYMLHKFPMLSKCLRLQRIYAEASQSSQHQIIQFPEFPGGIEAFELCAKFCYGITITVSAYNIVAARCAAEYLQMTEDAEKGNLVYKLEAFLNSCILQGWRDPITTLQSTKAFPTWAEDIGITTRCIEAIASKVLRHPSKMSLSHSHSRRATDNISCNGGDSQRHKLGGKGWWAEDLADLSIDLYWRTMIAIKSGGKIPPKLIGDALKTFASRWLPNISRKGKTTCKPSTSDSDSGSDSVSDVTSRHRLLLESILSLLPAERGSVSCRFLLKLLKAANILNASSSKLELARRVGLQLDEASVSDLLIPSLSYSDDTVYDVEIIMTILDQFMSQGQSPPTSPPRSKLRVERRRSRSVENIDMEFQESRRSSSASHGSKIKVAKLIDRYLQEIARDANLPLSRFIALAQRIPDFARIDHDHLYRAIDTYLRAHPSLSKSERKRLCHILDCKKLSMEACMHAAQNELLPLRVVVQVLFCEQARAGTTGDKVTELPSNLKAILAAHGIDASKRAQALSTTSTIQADDQWSVSGLKSPKSKYSNISMKLAKDNELYQSDMHSDAVGKSSRLMPFCALPSRPKRMFSKLWPSNRSTSGKN